MGDASSDWVSKSIIVLFAWLRISGFPELTQVQIYQSNSQNARCLSPQDYHSFMKEINKYPNEQGTRAKPERWQVQKHLSGQGRCTIQSGCWQIYHPGCAMETLFRVACIHMGESIQWSHVWTPPVLFPPDVRMSMLATGNFILKASRGSIICHLRKGSTVTNERLSYIQEILSSLIKNRE